MESITIRQTRRLALARAGLLKPEWTAFPRSVRGRGDSTHKAIAEVISRFGYLQLDTVSIAGARSHSIVLLSRLRGLDPAMGEQVLRPGAPVFEYWGHEASWIPLELYPAFEFRRREFRHHPWWGDLVGKHPDVARKLRRRVRDEGGIRSLGACRELAPSKQESTTYEPSLVCKLLILGCRLLIPDRLLDMEGRGSRGWWDLKIAKKVAPALWSTGEFAIRERRNFQRTYDLAGRIIPDSVRNVRLKKDVCIDTLMLKALDGHGWATTGTLAATWRLTNRKKELAASLDRLVARGKVVECALENPGGRPILGWARPEHLELAARLNHVRPRVDRGVLLSPFDPVLWDRARVERLFDFNQILEIFKPAPQRIYGYYCMPVLAGERLIARFDLKADRAKGNLRILSRRFETAKPSGADKAAAEAALTRYAEALGLKPV